MINILEHGAVGDGKFLNTAAFSDAIAHAKQTGEAILVPAGTFLTGTINLQGVSMHLESGAVIKGSSDIGDYPPQDYHHNEMGDLTALIVNLNHDNVSITGSGTIDFSGHTFYDTGAYNVPDSLIPFTDEQIRECTHPIGMRTAQSLFMHGSKNLTVSGIRLIDAPCWTLTFSECENVKITGVTIDTDLNIPNDDGIHISACKGVMISDCHISSGDDCIALSCITNWKKPCEDVVIANCVLRSCSKAIVIGYIYSVIKNVLISNCIIKESNRGLCFMCSDECGAIENVRVQNMIIDTRIRAGNWWGNGEPILMMLNKEDSHIPAEQKPSKVTEGSIRNVTISGVTCMSENAIGVVAAGGKLSEVTLRDIDIIRKPSDNIELKGHRFDLAPGRDNVEVPEDCAVLIKNADVRLESIRAGKLRIITV